MDWESYLRLNPWNKCEDLITEGNITTDVYCRDTFIQNKEN